ncbi:SMI1/KNR4 family protein [Streptomyces echinoruber]|uniref:Knr4/Smi1-like domain-containing protein n=1 Tax=Streptomyces echinoruber TaxID=68898 RepID=A0A918RB05_9ACTN|nr:SMI1/KNR4 family protein [Streptomyces echinoruber]GGZ90461.1 hypothetical protein GCM10010389_30980 [Streptomyces echinoruber]
MNDVWGQLQETVSLLREGGDAGDTVDWEAAAAELGVPGFPDDYREFVAAFGAGSFEDSLFVSVPRPGNPTAPLAVGRLPEDALQDDGMSVWQDPAVSRHRLQDMLVWGRTNGADALCWVTSGPEPNRWPVAVWARQNGGWAIHACGMAEFLLRVLRAEFAECPLSVTTLWGRGTARFLNFRDEERLLDEGIDPWTGESTDPFAGL